MDDRDAPQSARVLPVFLIVDTSGSMAEHGKIECLNLAIREMISSLCDLSSNDVEVRLAVITFGGSDSSVHFPLSVGSTVDWIDLVAFGATPLGAALSLLAKTLEIPTFVPNTSYSPTTILVTDGLPTDEYEVPLRRLLASDRGKDAVRIAVRIGPEADQSVLEFFTGTKSAVFSASDAAVIEKLFRHLTDVVRSRAKVAALEAFNLPSSFEFGDLSDSRF